MLKWLLPLFLILAAGGYFFGLKTGCGAVDNAVEATTGAVEKTAEMAGDATKGAAEMAGDAAKGAADMAKGAAGALGGVFGNINEAAKKALDGIKFGANSAGSQIMEYVGGGFKGDGRFTFNNLTFDTGSAQIKAATAVEVDNVSAILSAYPDVKVKVEGYTDNTGNSASNVQLSQARADAVKARLMGKGIAGDRVTTDGLGSANPRADNGTAEGRAQNRRIEMIIMK